MHAAMSSAASTSPRPRIRTVVTAGASRGTCRTVNPLSPRPGVEGCRPGGVASFLSPVGHVETKTERSVRVMAKIDRFEMERYQSLHWHEVEHDLSESGVSPLTSASCSVRTPTRRSSCRRPSATRCRRIPEARHHIAQWYPDAGPRERDRDERRLRGQPPGAVVAPRFRRPSRVHDPQLPAGPRPRARLRQGRRHVPAPRPATVGGRSTSRASSVRSGRRPRS